MKTFNNTYETHHISIEEYKRVFKPEKSNFTKSITNKNSWFFKDDVFFMRFAGVLFLLLVFFVALLAV